MVRVMVLRSPGANCDQETAYAFECVGAEVERVHVARLLEGSKRLMDYGVLVLPGGFTYADDVGAGRVLANTLRFRLRDELGSFVADGRPVLGVCNGFQILMQLGLLGGGRGRSSLTFNESGRFECRWSRLEVGLSGRCAFLEGLPAQLQYPVAHGEGRFVADAEALAELEDGLIAFRYEGSSYPANPNGSDADIAGLCDETGRILGLMPHPERALARRGDPEVVEAGRRLFANIVAAA